MNPALFWVMWQRTLVGGLLSLHFDALIFTLGSVNGNILRKSLQNISGKLFQFLIDLLINENFLHLFTDLSSIFKRVVSPRYKIGQHI